jgi:tRNA threonylcarbamoyladenosine biosynthesis protein TsaB
MSIVPMRVEDLDEVAALEARIQAYPWTPGNFRDSLLSGHGCWVAREAGNLAGFAVTLPAVHETHLLVIGVAPGLQRRGRGRAMLAFVETQARQADMERMLLEVRPSNLPALAFYAHAGYTEIGRRRGYYPAIGGREDAIVMTKTL